MTDKQSGAEKTPPKALRALAEERVRQKRAELPETMGSLTDEQARKLLHELRVHQVELELQNEELLAAEEQLKASRARYQDLYNIAPVGYITLDAGGLVLTANATAGKQFGAEKEALEGRPLTRFVFSEDQDIFYLHRKRLESSTRAECELRLTMADSSVFWGRLDSVMAPGESGATECRITVVDITERKKAEAEQLRLAEQVTRQAREMDEFMYLTVHDLSVPLIKIAGFSQNLLRDCGEICKAAGPALGQEKNARLKQILCESVPSTLSFIQESTAKMHQLLDAALKVHRAGQPGKNPETVSADEALKSALKPLQSSLAKAGGKLQASPLPACKATPGALEYIFGELLSNAVRFRDKTRPLEITVRGERDAEGNPVYRIEDNGCGISEEDLTKIFRLFYRGGPPDAERGEGIGLPMARILADNNGGRIWAESKEGRGSAFFVQLPG